MRLITLFLFLFFASHSICAQDTIYWSVKRKLTWNDFKGKPDSLSGFKAMTLAGMGYGIRFGEKSFSYKIDCYFLCHKSWTLADSASLLIHEQGHFDIAELFARKMRKAFSDYKYNYESVSEDLKKIQAEILQARAEMNNLYDRETDYSKDKKQQQAWNLKIKTELDKLKDCASN